MSEPDGRAERTAAFQSREDAAGGADAVDQRFPEWLAIDRYQRMRRLGRGGMGEVYCYLDVLLDRLAAVKTIPASRVEDREWQDRLEDEARAIARLDHPNVGRIYDLLREETGRYLVLEFVPGRTLQDVLGSGSLPVERAVAVCLQVGRAIEAGHARDIIHRDVKPANIMISNEGHVKLLDYGLARHRPFRDSARPGSGDVDDSERGRVMGTFGYMSPEQARGEPVTKSADVWALGCVLFECLAGRAAFPGATKNERLASTLDREPDWTRLPRQMPEPVRRVIELCLRKDQSARLRDVGDACLDLEASPATTMMPVRAPIGGSALPVPFTTFVRRAGELERLGGLLEARSEGPRLLTLTGFGGAGKTRLAPELARRWGTTDGSQSDRLPAGVCYIELAAVTDDARVAEAVASALWGPDAVRPFPDRSTLEAIATDLATGPHLVVLDNCEHVRDACTVLARELLSRCPGLRILATSREALGITGEKRYRVPGLSCPPESARGDIAHFEAVQLFADRAGLADERFELTPANAPQVAEICRRLEGMPLAIELAAARVGGLAVDEIAQRIFDVLDQDVIRSLIQWSVDLLRPVERRMLGRLAVFRSGWTLKAAERICGERGRPVLDGEPVVDLLGLLVDKSLVQYEAPPDRPPRYHLLETVRAFAERTNRGSALRSTRQRHLAYYLDLACEADRNIGGPDQAAWMNRIGVEYENLLTALRTSVTGSAEAVDGVELVCALHIFWYLRGRLSEGRTWCEEVRQHRAGVRDVAQMRVLNVAGSLAQRARDLEVAIDRFREAVALARELDDGVRLAGLLTNFGIVHEEAGDFESARAAHEEAIEQYRAAESADGVVMGELNLGVVLKLLGSYDDARRVLERCRGPLEKMGDQLRLAALFQSLGEITYLENRNARRALNDAADCFRRALFIFRELGAASETARALAWLAIAAGGLGHDERATCLLGAASAIRDENNARLDPHEQVECDAVLADLRRRLEERFFDETWRRGNSMSIEQAVSYALHIDSADTSIV